MALLGKKGRPRMRQPNAMVQQIVSTNSDSDIISTLPNDVLARIISTLPTDGAIRTRAISRRWKKLWYSASLNLDDSDLITWRYGDDLEQIITRILSSHPGPAHRFSVTRLCRVSDYHGDRYPSFARWFQSPVLDMIKELHFCYLLRTERDPLPPSALRFNNLHVASYGHCHFPDNLGDIHFPHLRQLTLHGLTNTESALQAMLLACPVLKSLLLEDNNSFRSVDLSSQTLVSLGVSVATRSAVLEDLVIVDAPRMKRFILFITDEGPINIRIMGAPKLEVLGSVSSAMQEVQLGNTVFQKMGSISPVTIFHGVKIFSISAQDFQFIAVINILKCFPCLGKLYFTTMAEDAEELLKGDPSIQCLYKHLKEVILKNYRGSREDVSLASFFISYTRELKSVQFHVPFEYRKNWEVNQRRKLPRLKNRASRIARFKFVPDPFFKILDNRYMTHELVNDDPFENQL